MMASRTNGGHHLPPYYLVYFLLVDLLGFANLGQWEKVAWIVPIRYSGRLYSIWPAYAIRRHAEWTGQAAIDAFFSWTEHAFIHIAILKGVLRTGDEVAALAGGDWKAKFKAALPIGDAEMKRHYMKHMKEFIEHMKHQVDRSANMDW